MATVSALPRSGTSLMMQMLQAGGVTPAPTFDVNLARTITGRNGEGNASAEEIDSKPANPFNLWL